MSASLLEQAADLASGLDLDSVPTEVVTHLGHVIADTVGVSRAGAMSEEMSRLVKLYVDEGVVHPAGTGDAGSTTSSTVLTADLPRTTAARAAFLNATAGTFLELDEGMRPTGHPGMHVVPAALAVAERRHVDGAQLLRAVLAGYEVTSRLFLAFRLRYPVHPHGHFGAVGAAVAVAMLEDVDPVAAARAAGTAVLLPVWEACYEGATVRNTWTGLAAEAGVRAAALVRAGFEGSRRTLEIGYGTIAGDLVDPDAMVKPLDYANLGVTRDYFKLHSACALTHAAIDAVLEMRPDPDDVVSVQVETVANNMKLDRQPLPSALSGRFSLPYAVATAIALGRSDPEAFRFRPEVAALGEKVKVSVAADLEAQWPDSSPARVSIQTSTGTRTQTVDNPRGHHRRPIGAEELRAKFIQLVGRQDGDLWWPRLTALVDVQDVADVFARAR
jgi:2-methylcitrate dehydratase PrpD